MNVDLNQWWIEDEEPDVYAFGLHLEHVGGLDTLMAIWEIVIFEGDLVETGCFREIGPVLEMREIPTGIEIVTEERVHRLYRIEQPKKII